jgi:hypothetical protein
MRITVSIEGDLAGMMAREVRAAERAVTLGVHATGASLQADLRAQVAAARLGADLTKSVRKRNYPSSGQSISAASLVYSKASKLLDSFDRGSVIRSRRGLWLAIPLAPAGGRRSLRNNRSGRFEGLTPAVWERRNGQRLRFVYLGKARALLVADDARLNAKGRATRKGGKRRRDGILTGAQTVPVFLLVPQVKMPKRLTLEAATNAAAARLPGAILANWTDS